MLAESYLSFKETIKKEKGQCCNAEHVLPVCFKIQIVCDCFLVITVISVLTVLFVYIVITAMPNGQWLNSCGEY